MKRPNLLIIGIKEVKESQLKNPENTFNKIIKQTFPNIKKEMPVKVKDVQRTPNGLDQKRKSLII